MTFRELKAKLDTMSDHELDQEITGWDELHNEPIDRKFTLEWDALLEAYGFLIHDKN